MITPHYKILSAKGIDIATRIKKALRFFTSDSLLLQAASIHWRHDVSDAGMI